MNAGENIQRGKQAIAEILETHGAVNGAMERPETGPIDFLWGEEGNPDKNYAGGYGIAKILAKHGEKAVAIIPEVVASGRAEHRNADRVHFVLGDFTAVVKLDFDGKKKTWLVTNFEKYPNKKDSNSAGDFARPAPTPGSPDSAAGGNLSSAHTIPQNQQNGKTQAGYENA